jgi:hypothetical protein
MLAGVIKVQIFLPPKQGRKDPHVPKFSLVGSAMPPFSHFFSPKKKDACSSIMHKPSTNERPCVCASLNISKLNLMQLSIGFLLR